MSNQPIPTPVVKRLSLYLRQLKQFAKESVATLSSRRLAQSLGLTDAQVRKDLACFGQFGTPGVGYDVSLLEEKLRKILGTDKPWNVIVLGASGLGQALLKYNGFDNKGFRLVAAFETDPKKIGQQIGGVTVYPLSKLPQIINRSNVRLAILAVPADAAQQAADLFCANGIKGILNFAPITLETPPGVSVGPVDIAAHLEQLSFMVTHTP